MRIIVLHVGLCGSVSATVLVTRYVSQGIQWGAALERHSRIVVLLSSRRCTLKVSPTNNREKA
jgi:hypothetical protein